MRKKFKVVIAIGFLCLCNCVAISQEGSINGLSADAEKTILEKTVHKLTWHEYRGYGNKENAIYLLDGFILGKGSEGLSTLKYIITRMPAKSIVKIVPYYGDPGGEMRLEYPFDLSDLYKYFEKYGVSLGSPGTA